MSSPRVDRSLQGIGLCTLGYAFLTLQDAAIKWLVADYSVVTILFWRALVVVAVVLAAGRTRLIQRAWYSPSRRLLVVRGLLSIVAWLLYYTAARDLTLAEMTTLYFSAPIMVTVLAAVILKERASGWQWFSLIVGFVGVVIAIGPEGGWSPRDREILRTAGFSGLKLGPRILRTETAGLAAIAALQSRFGDLSPEGTSFGA